MSRLKLFPHTAWGELMKLDVPFNDIPGCHVFFLFRNRKERSATTASSGASSSDKPFAFAFLPLFGNNAAFVTDGSHGLVLYRYEQQYAKATVYLNGPSTARPGMSLSIAPSHAKALFPLRDFVNVRTFLCSTRLTQDPTLLRLFDWKRSLLPEPAALTETLSKLPYSPEFERVKMTTHIFEALFALLASSMNEGGEIDDLVFTALVNLLGELFVCVSCRTVIQIRLYSPRGRSTLR